MPADIEVIGLENLARLSSALRSAGDQGKGLKRELSKGINRETKQTRMAMRRAILPVLPKSGGLAADVQGSTRFTTVTRPSGANIGVSIRARGRRSIRRMNATGTFRHPVFGNREVWRDQFVSGLQGFLDRPFDASRPELQRATLLAIARIRGEIYRSA